MSRSILLLILLLFFSFFGASNTILTKYIYLQKSKNSLFIHNWFFDIIMFFAEMMGIPLYYLTHFKKTKKETKEDSEFDSFLNSSEEEKKVKVGLSKIKKIVYLSYPFIFDSIASSIGFICLIIIPASINNLLKGVVIIIITFLISKFYLKNKHTFDQYIAFIISIIGFILVFLSAFFGDKSNNSTDETNIGLNILGIFLVIISVILQSIGFCLEEYYMKTYSFHPFLFIGSEGLCGFIFNIILCIIFYFIKCGSNPSELLKNLCTKDEDDIWRVENALFAFEQVFDNKIILIYIIFLTISISAFNMFGIHINKFGGAMARSLVENSRAFFVWLFFMLPWVNEDLRESFNWIRLFGLIFIFGSIIIYFGVLKFDEKKKNKMELKALSNFDDFFGEIPDESLDRMISMDTISDYEKN